MTDLRTAAQQALKILELEGWGYPSPKTAEAITALKAALVEPVLQTCNCRWDGEVQVQQCTLHEAHVDAIHEWAERAKTAEKKLAALAEPVQEPVAWIHTDPDNPRVRFLEWREDEPGYRGRWIKTPLFIAPLGCFNCASLQAQNTELDRKLTEMDTALRAQL